MKIRFRLISAALFFILALSGLGAAGPGTKVEAATDVRAAWISYIDMGDAGLKGASEASFRSKVSAIFDQAAAKNLNTVYVHVRAFNDAIYPSPNFGWADWITSNKSGPGYDPLWIMIELAHQKGLRIEAWMNPYRVSTSTARTSTVKSASTPDQLSRMIEYTSSSGQDCLVLNPADAQVRSMITSEVGYIVQNYNVDGVHFDDYFYDPAYYGSTTADQRRSYVNDLIRSIYSKIKSINSSVRFGISPAGNVSNCLNDGADVSTWLSSAGYIDYLVPQIYWSDSYGSAGTANMFTNRLNDFLSMNKNGTDIYTGLALYNVAAKPSTSVDPGWTNSSSNLADQMRTAYGKGVKGYSLFSSQYLDDASTQTELSNLADVVRTQGVVNLAASKLPAASSSSFKNISLATDGIAGSYADSAASTGLQWVQLDLGASGRISSIRLWHYFGDARTYHDVVVQLSDDPAFKTGVTTVFNNDTDGSAGLGAGTDSEYAESSAGKTIAFSPVSARYARFWASGSTANGCSHYAEIEVYGTPGQPDVNLAASKLPASSSAAFKNLSLATDGSVGSYADSFTCTGPQWVQLDLGSSSRISSIKLWHYFGDSRTYHDVVVQLSDDPAFKTGVTTVFNNDKDGSSGLGAGTDAEYAETSSGKYIAFSPVSARYARFWSSGSTANSCSHYAEIEVYGTPGRADINLAASKLPTASSSAFKNLSLATDGSVGSYADSAAGTGLQWVQLDLGSSSKVSSIRLWHYFGDGRTYHDVVVQLSDDPAFKTGVTTVFNNDADGSAGLGAGTDAEYGETSAGKCIAFNPVSARYARFWSSGSTANSCSHYAEIQVYGTPGQQDINLAASKLPAASSSFNNLSMATDGSVGSYADSAAGTGLQWVQLDLGSSSSISSIRLWHYFGDGRTYHDVVVQLSDDPAFKTGVTTVFNSDMDGSAGLGTGTDAEYAETSAGKTIAFSPVSARYARFWSSGSTANSCSHYAEIQVYGTPGQQDSNLAASKLPTASSPSFKGLSLATDGSMGSYADSCASGLQWVQLDLGYSRSISSVRLWHYFGDARKYHDVVVQLSDDPTFATGVTTVFSNDADNSAGQGNGTDSEYTETSSGRCIAFFPVSARYVRLWSNGSTVNSYNHYAEIEIYGK